MSSKQADQEAKKQAELAKQKEAKQQADQVELSYLNTHKVI